MFTDFKYLEEQIPHLWGIEDGTKVSVKAKGSYFTSSHLYLEVPITSNLGEARFTHLTELITAVLVDKTNGGINTANIEFQQRYIPDFEEILVLFK